MKHPVLFFAGIFLLFSASCKKDCNCANENTPAPKKGAVLFWTNDPQVLSNCGALTIRLSNGQESTINGFYFTAPANCANQFGGYFYLEEGTYTYQIIPQNAACAVGTGSLTVTGDQCNLRHI